MPWYRPTLERVSQLAFVAMCVVVSAVGIQRLAAKPVAVSGARPSPMQPGTKVDLHADLAAGAARGSVVLALSTNCRFCTASMPFYAKLSALDALRDGRVRLSVVSLQDETQMRGYLSANSVSVGRIVPWSDSGLTIEATPTLVIVDRAGTVVKSWSGQLRPDEEEAVIRSVTQLASR